MNQSQFLAITCNSLEAREKSRVHGAIGFGFASHWLKNWRESFQPVTTRSDRNNVINFNSHLKTALSDIVSNLNSKIKLFADGAVMYRETLSSQDKVISQNYIDLITDQNLANEP